MSTPIAAILGIGMMLALAMPAAAQIKEEPPSPRLLQRLGTNQLRHGSRILCLTFSPQGDLLVAGGGSDPVRVWDTKTGQQKYACGESWINAIVFSPRGSQFYTAGAFKTIRIFDAPDGKDGGKLEGHHAAVKALAIAPGGDMMVSGAQDGTIILWEVPRNKKIVEMKQHTGEITSLAYPPVRIKVDDDEFNNGIFVSGSNDRMVCVWNGETGQLLHKLDAGCGVLAVAVSRDAKTVFAAGDDNVIRMWDAESGKPSGTLKGHDGMVNSLVVSRDGKSLISGSRDNTIRIWDLQAKDKQPRVIQRHAGDNDALALSKDGKRLATAGLNNTIRIFETASGKELLASDSPQAGLNGLVLSKDGKHLAAITAHGVVYLWDAASGKLLRDWQTGHTGEITLAFTPDGQSIVTAAERIVFWDPQTGKQRFDLPKNEKAVVLSLNFAPDGKTLAVGLRGGQVQLWDTDGKNPAGSFPYPGQPYAVAFSHDGKLVAAAGGSKIVLFDRAANKELRRFECKDAPPKTLLPDVAALAFSPDKKTIAVACFDGVIRFLNIADGKEAGVCEGHLSVPYAITYAHDGRTLLSGSFDSTVRLWEPYSGAQLAEFKGHTGPVYGVALSPNGKLAYSAAADTNVLVWDATGFGKKGIPNNALGPNDLDTAWKDLANDNAAAARLTTWNLITNPKDVAAFLKTKVALVDVPRIRKLLADLDSDDFDERDAAFKELANQGRWLEDRLEEALIKPPSLEYKRRIEQLQEKLRVPGALTLRQEQIRMRRVLMILERIGDTPAVDLLDQLTRQAPSDALCDEAVTTLMRMGKTPQPKTAGAK